MRVSFGKKPLIYPQPVLIIGTYNEDGSVNAMNAAWGGICGEDKIAICIDEGHKKDGISSVKLTKLGSDSESFSYERKINLSFNDEDTVGFWLYKDDSYNLDADSEIDLFLQSYNSEYNYFETKIKGTDLTDGWNFIKLKKKDFEVKM